MLEIQSLSVARGGGVICQDISFTVQKGEVLSITGKNGSGKSTLGLAIMGHPACEILSGDMLIDGVSFKNTSPTERSAMGIGMVFQLPREISGVRYKEYLYQLHKTRISRDLGLSFEEIRRSPELRRKISLSQFSLELQQYAQQLSLSESVFDRSIHESFSGGEKKKSELIQVCIMKPQYLIIDEIDAGLDAKSFQTCMELLVSLRKEIAMILITHNEKCFEYLQPDTRISL